MKKLFYLMLPFLPFQLQSLPVEQIEDFSFVFETVKNYYVDEINEKDLMNYAIVGMIGQLDPHSDYMDEKTFSSLDSSTSGSFGGLGLELSSQNNMLEVISAIDDSPAAAANLEAHDLILSINGTFTHGLSLKDASSLIRGKPGSLVTLTVLKKNQVVPIDLKIERMIIKVPSVKSQVINDEWGYLRIASFSQKTGDEFRDLLHKLMLKKPHGIILDLRNNPGGVLKSSADVANCFLSEKNKSHDSMIVFAKGRENKITIQEKIHGEDMTHNLPLVVLINGGSASASEIVAGALQDYKRGVILGEKSFGKGSVQTVIPMNGKALKLTCSRYFTPSGRSIQAQGITPDISIDRNWKKVENQEVISIKESNLNKHLTTENEKGSDLKIQEIEDYQLTQAIQILKALSISKN